jgi:hypothetical protein
MKDEKGRRDFLRKAAAAFTFPAVFQWGSKTAYALEGSSTGGPKAGKAKVKKICVDEHWAPKTGEPPRLPKSVNTAARPQAVRRLKDFDLRLPLMGEMKKQEAGSREREEAGNRFYSRFRLLATRSRIISGIAMQVRAPAPIQVIPDTNAAVAAASKCNDAAAETVQKYAPRFSGFAAILTQDPKAAADELDRAVTQLGLKGAMVYGHTNGE